MHHVRRLRIMAALLAAALLAAACGADATSDDRSPSTATAAADSTTAPTTAPDIAPGSVSGATIQEARRAVVQIFQVSGLVTPEGEVQSVSGGSGFFIDPSGIAVTNNHVVGGGAAYEVYVQGEDEPRNARVIGLSECSDLAVIDVEGEGFPYLEFWDGEPTVSTPVLAAGFPLLDPEFTLTRGIISKQEAGGDTYWASVGSVLEHDARINPGNSGGPLLTEDGYVIGVNYRGRADTGQFYAIETQYAIPIIDDLTAGVVNESIGLNAEAFAFGDIPGLWVYGVETGSPADLAGIKGGDFITELENVGIAADGTLRRYCDILHSQGVDQPMAVQVFRGSTGEILEGRINGEDPMEVVFSPDAAGTPTVVSGGGAYSEFVTLTDDTGLISMQVPAAFADVQTATLETDVYGSLPAILAAEDLSTAVGPNAYSGNGALLLAFTSGGLDMVTTLVEIAESDLDFCELAGDPQEFETGNFEGVIVTLVNCAGAQSSIIFVGAQIPGESRFVILGIQAVDDAMVNAIPTILSSFRFNR